MFINCSTLAHSGELYIISKESKMYQVKLKNTSKEPIWLVPPKLSIGSANDNDIILNNHGIKQHHADLVVDNNNIYLLPDKSANDIFINGEQIRQSHTLKEDDIITLCNTELKILKPHCEGQQEVISDSLSDKWTLEVLNGAESGKAYPLKKTNTIGRSPDCEIQLIDEKISRKHARLDIIGGALKITDMGSANGCQVNDTKITSAYARPNDILKIGMLEFKINGPFLDADKTTINTSKIVPITPISKKSAPVKQPQSNTFIRREQILESKQALRNLNSNKNNHTKTLVLISCITLVLAVASSILIISG